MQIELFSIYFPRLANPIDEARARKLSKIEAMKKRPLKRPDWNELMREIDSFKYGHSQRLRKTVCNDRSKPMLTKIKIKGKVRIPRQTLKKHIFYILYFSKAKKMKIICILTFTYLFSRLKTVNKWGNVHKLERIVMLLYFKTTL